MDTTFEAESSVDINSLPNFRVHEQNEFVSALEASLEPKEMGGASAEGGSGGGQQQTGIPEKIKSFLTYFQKHIHQKNVDEITSLYDSTFRKLTESYYRTQLWPSGEAIAPIVDNDRVFLILYKELYYRHVYSIPGTPPTLKQRFESWQNYCDLFEYWNTARDLALPLQWLWDIIDEYIYQFQSFSQNRSKLKNKTKEELTMLKAEPSVWHVAGVLGHLQSLVDRAKLTELRDKPEWDSKNMTVQQSLGYFAAIGLLRVHCLLGDYHLALKSLEPINLTTNRGLHVHVSACHISLYYYLGFAFLMMHHYAAAVKVFTNILTYINRTEQYHTRSYQYYQIIKKSKQMYTLLAISVSLSPGKLTDGHIERRLNEKYGDKMQKIQRRDEATLQDMFFKSCPKFISAHAPNYDEEPLRDYQHDARNVQLKVFMDEVRRHAIIPIIRSYLKLYTTITIPKLASFLDVDESTCRSYLLCYKNKTRSLVWTGGSSLSSDWVSSSDITFYIDKDDMVHVADTKVARRDGEYFLSEINRLKSLRARLK